ncbi:MAG: hypothetical protein LUH21_04805 [Clostridiales bacterium]|nr:hypothetical protein [Clostridiales bacterium]
MKVTLYSSPYCGQCKAIANVMDKKNIVYEKIDDEEISLKVGMENSITSMPFAEIEGKFFTTVELMNWVNNQN